MKKVLIVVLSLVGILVCGLASLYFVRPSIENLDVAYAESPPPKKGAVTVRWLGVSTLLIDDGDTQIMTDGFFTRPPIYDIVRDKDIQSDTAFVAAQIRNFKIDRLAAV